jgi:hypothetical protein
VSGRSRALRIVWVAVVWTACVPLDTIPGPSPAPFLRAADANGGPEPYSAWFGAAGDSILYFGTSPFWTLWWETDGDPRADLAQAGDHLIGRFDMAAGRFLPPLRVRSGAEGAHGSVWDVLVHSNGRIYYTTLFEEIGSVGHDGADVRHFEELGLGFNELWEGPDGQLWVTRYASRPTEPGREGYGAVVVLTPDGDLVREIRFERQDGVFTAPKSVAVDPTTGEIWLNADLFSDDGHTDYAAFRLAPDGEILERRASPPELHFVTFGPDGTGWFVWDHDGELWLRATRGGAEVASAYLGPRSPGDFVQDVKPWGEGRVALALWSGRAYVASLHGAGLSLAQIPLERPRDCRPPAGRSLLYTAVVHGGRLWATLYCGWTILGAPIPEVMLPRTDLEEMTTSTAR